MLKVIYLMLDKSTGEILQEHDIWSCEWPENAQAILNAAVKDAELTDCYNVHWVTSTRAELESEHEVLQFFIEEGDIPQTTL